MGYDGRDWTAHLGVQPTVDPVVGCLCERLVRGGPSEHAGGPDEHADGASAPLNAFISPTVLVANVRRAAVERGGFRAARGPIVVAGVDAGAVGLGALAGALTDEVAIALVAEGGALIAARAGELLRELGAAALRRARDREAVDAVLFG
jgi:hypothetical protein